MLPDIKITLIISYGWIDIKLDIILSYTGCNEICHRTIDADERVPFSTLVHIWNQTIWGLFWHWRVGAFALFGQQTARAFTLSVQTNMPIKQSNKQINKPSYTFEIRQIWGLFCHWRARAFALSCSSRKARKAE